MVGIFSRFSVGRAGHRRSQSALDERASLPPNSETPGTAENTSVASHHGIEVAVEFKPVEHPNEPLDNDRPIQCPLPEPSILNDGRIWKERVSATVRRRADLPVMKEGGSLESEGTETGPEPEPEPKPRPKSLSPQTQPIRTIFPSVSAPEHNILNLLEECNSSGV